MRGHRFQRKPPHPQPLSPEYRGEGSLPGQILNRRLLGHTSLHASGEKARKPASEKQEAHTILAIMITGIVVKFIPCSMWRFWNGRCRRAMFLHLHGSLTDNQCREIDRQFLRLARFALLKEETTAHGHRTHLPTIEELRRHVHDTLCAHDRLDPVQTPLHQAVINRSGRPCGILFQVQGPRLLKTYAVWAGEEDRILFYDSTGLRSE